jgi:hypothetical protein
MNKIAFADIKQDILEALKKLPEDAGITEGVDLVDGFINNPLNKDLTDSIMIGGPTVPMILLVGQKSGRVYLFALKRLLPGKISW